MADQWVLNTQLWLNDTYTGVPEWNPVEADGNTGWPTMYALTRALQYELGLPNLSDNFGAGTLSAVAALGDIGKGSGAPKNVVRILQGAMYCKGYNGGNGFLDGDFSDTTAAGVSSLRSDIGLTPNPATIFPKLFKALLTMDAYVLVAGGNATIRAIQRDLNGRYIHRHDYFITPADGFYSRDVQRGLMFALQYEIGMSDGVANGNFGPGTQTGLANSANFGAGDSDTSSGKYFIHLYQAALIFNGYPSAYAGVFDQGTVSATTSFQAFCLLQVTARSDFRTWASLLVSTGDPSRPGTAADTIRQITPARAATLVAHGYETVGRYLTNEPYDWALDKNIKPGELTDIFSAGLSVFPIFQEGGTGLSYFNYWAGFTAGQKAHVAARGYGFLAGTTIYFAVDFDAIESQVHSNVVPYFQGVRDGLASNQSQYIAGIYGSRNTCAIVSAANLASTSFVSGMSTGFSGNLGYPLPFNWAFDQVLEYEIGAGDGWVNIDKDIKSGRDAGQSQVSIDPVPPESDFQRAIRFCYEAQAAATRYRAQGSQMYSVPELTTRYLRHRSYDGPLWTLLGGQDTPDFYDYADDSIGVFPDAFDPDDRHPVGGFDWPHMLATASVYTYRGTSNDQLDPELGDQGGWTGDLITLASEYITTSHSYSSAFAFIEAALNGAFASSFGSDDLHGDIAAWAAVFALEEGVAPSFARGLEFAVTNSGFTGENRFDVFIRGRWGNIQNGFDITRRIFTLPSDTPERVAFITARAQLLWESNGQGNHAVITDFTSADFSGIAKAFVNKIANLSTQYSPLP